MKKPDLLLLHGAIATKEQFDPLISSLEDHFCCHSLNFSGHGLHDSNKPFGIVQFAQDVIEWMDAHQYQSIDIFGYSMGGYVAIYLTYLHPGRIGRVFTLATKFDWTPENAKEETKLLNPEKIAEKIPAFAEILKAKHRDWKAVLNQTAQMMINMSNTPLLTHVELSQINHQLVISVGDEDQTATAKVAHDIHKKLKNSQLLILFNTSHPFEKVDLEVLSSHIKAFFMDNTINHFVAK